MNENEIDQLFLNLKNRNYKEIFKMIGMEFDASYIEEKNVFKQAMEQVYAKIMEKVDKKGFEYFCNQISKNNGLGFIFLTYSKNKEFVHEIIEDRQRRKDMGIDNIVKLQLLLKDWGDEEYKKEIIESPEKREKMSVKSSLLFSVIVSLKDKEYQKNILLDDKKTEELGIDARKKIALINAIGDFEYIRNLLDNPQKIEELKLTNDDITTLIQTTKNKEYMKSILEDPRKIEKFEFTTKNIHALIVGVGEKTYIKNIIEDQEKIKKLRLDSKSIMFLLLELGDKQYIKNILLNDEKSKSLGLYNDERNLGTLLKEVGETEFIINYAKDKGRYKEQNSSQSNIDAEILLPENMTIGVEIECEGENSEILIALRDFENGWSSGYDGSLKNGVEVVSPILTGDTQITTESIKKVCGIINSFGQTVSERCGGHVHIGAHYLTTKESWENLTELWGNCEEILYIISNKEGEIPRNDIGKYAKPISGAIEKRLNCDTVKLESEEDLKKFIKDVQVDRAYGINFANVGERYNTVEFRLANGTIDAKTWIENINLFGGLIKTAEDLAIIQSKQEDELTEEDRIKIESFEKIKDKEISDEEKLSELLKIVVPESIKDVYMKRYETNSKLIDKNQSVKKVITEKVASKSIYIEKKRVGKKVFTGPDCVLGQEMDEYEKIKNMYLEKDSQDIVK